MLYLDLMEKMRQKDLVSNYLVWSKLVDKMQCTVYLKDSIVYVAEKCHDSCSLKEIENFTDAQSVFGEVEATVQRGLLAHSLNGSEEPMGFQNVESEFYNIAVSIDIKSPNKFYGPSASSNVIGWSETPSRDFSYSVCLILQAKMP